MVQKVKGHGRVSVRGTKFSVGPYERKSRKKKVKIKVLRKPIKLYPRVDIYGRKHGFSSRYPGRLTK